jgi:hypothetical protein
MIVSRSLRRKHKTLIRQARKGRPPRISALGTHGAAMARSSTFAIVCRGSPIRQDRRRSSHGFALVRTFRIRDAEVPGSNPGTPTRVLPTSQARV